jgi:hypothetical protein
MNTLMNHLKRPANTNPRLIKIPSLHLSNYVSDLATPAESAARVIVAGFHLEIPIRNFPIPSIRQVKYFLYNAGGWWNVFRKKEGKARL